MAEILDTINNKDNLSEVSESDARFMPFAVGQQVREVWRKIKIL